MRPQHNHRFNGRRVSSSTGVRRIDDTDIFEMDLPGLNREDLSVRIADRRMIIETKKRDEVSAPENSGGLHELPTPYFRKEFHLAENIDINSIAATGNDGV